MNRRISLLGWILGGIVLGGPLGAQVLGPGSTLGLSGQWKDPVPLEALAGGTWRLEALAADGSAVEVLVDRWEAGTWKAQGTNRTFQGTLSVQVELTVADGERWRVRPAKPTEGPVRLSLNSAVFSGLRNTLKQGLTAGPNLGAPLVKRAELPRGTGGGQLSAAGGPKGELWVGWIGSQGIQIWDVEKQGPVGNLGAVARGTWTTLEMAYDGGPRVSLRGSDRTGVWVWTGLDWAEDGPEPPGSFVTAQGRFRAEKSPVRVYRAVGGTWADLELPRDDEADQVLLGATADGLYAFLYSSGGPHRALYSWSPPGGWRALPVPPRSPGEGPSTLAMTNGSGALFFLEAQGKSLSLTKFDGRDWTPPLDLSALGTEGIQALCLLPPLGRSRTGMLVLATDRIRVYDLP